MVPPNDNRGNRIDPKGLKLVRTPQPSSDEDEENDKPLAVNAGAIDRVIDLAFNPSREKIREVTVIDRLQGRLLPQLDLIDTLWGYVVEVAFFRQDFEEYKRVYKKKRPVPPDLIGNFIYRTAQWQKSIAGKNLERAIDIALAETETKTGEEGDYNNDSDAWKD